MTEHAVLLPRYQHLRKVALQLNHRLVETLPKSVLDESGKKLGILQKGILVLETEDEIAVLMDYGIYDVRRQGRNAIERYLAESPPPADSDEMVLLQAMRAARYTLMMMETAEPGVGVHVHDLLRDEKLFVIDVGFSHSAMPGVIVAGRFVAVEGFWMSTGAVLPFGVLPAEGRAGVVQQMLEQSKIVDYRRMKPEEASEFSAGVIRRCLKQGAAEHVQYAEPGQALAEERRWGRGPAAAGPRSVLHVGRNDPCPCGSGKKFKRCCGAPR